MLITKLVPSKMWEGMKNNDYLYFESLDIEGFVHCSTVQQVRKVANKHYKKVENLLVLLIDTNKLIPNVVWEDIKHRGEIYPHIYDKINTSSIIGVFKLDVNENGDYKYSDALKNYL
jgi:uncharacterized protein (DUF952 family)